MPETGRREGYIRLTHKYSNNPKFKLFSVSIYNVQVFENNL